MMLHNSKHKWIEVGYELFAKEGTDSIHVERLARMLDRNKSAFYHYFKNPENFASELFNYHKAEANKMVTDIQRCKTLDPDFLTVVIKHKLYVLMQFRLASMNHDPWLRKITNGISQLVDQAAFPLWRTYFNLPREVTLVSRHLNLCRNGFLAHAKIEMLTYEYLHTFILATREMMEEVFEYQLLLNTKSSFIKKT